MKTWQTLGYIGFFLQVFILHDKKQESNSPFLPFFARIYIRMMSYCSCW